MLTNQQITEAVLSKREVTSLRKLQAKVDAMPPSNKRIPITAAQHKAMRDAFLVLQMLGKTGPAEEAMAKELRLI